MKYNLSIIIPTKNRQYYCLKSVQQIINVINKQDYNVEIVINDNSDNNSLEYDIKKINYQDMKYNYVKEPLSFVDNFNEAVKLSKGDYILLIGDDDGILQTIFPTLDYAYKNDIDAIIPNLEAVYFWPSEKDIIKNSKNGLLYFTKRKIKTKNIDPKKEIIKLMSEAAQNYQSFDLTRIYHGIVRKEILVKNKSLKYFGGLTPDIYSSITTSLHSKNAIKTSFPVTISGISAKSGSADSVTGKHEGDLKLAPHFIGHKSYEWNEKIAKIYSVETIWAETAIKALLDFEKNEIVDKFNYKYLEYILKTKYKNYLDNIDYEYKNSKLRNLYYKLKYSVKQFSKRVFRRININNKLYKKYGVNTLNQAEKIITSKISNEIIYKSFKRKGGK